MQKLKEEMFGKNNVKVTSESLLEFLLIIKLNN